MTKFFTLLTFALVPFSVFGMGEENQFIGNAFPHMHTDFVIEALNRDSISKVTCLVNNLNGIDFNTYKTDRYGHEISILRRALERCNPCEDKEVKLIELILQKGTSITPASNKIEPYLFYAIRTAARHENNISIVKLLIKYGADVNERFYNEAFYSPTHFTFSTKRFINGERCGSSPLHKAVEYYTAGSTCIDYLLELGANAKAYNIQGLTPLGTLVEKYKANNCESSTIAERVIEKLVEYDVDIHNSHSYNYENLNINYSTLKLLMPHLDDIIEKAKLKNLSKKSFQQLTTNFKTAIKNNLHTNRSITIKTQEFKFNESIIGARCPCLYHQFNPDYRPNNLLNNWFCPPLITWKKIAEARCLLITSNKKL